MKVKIIRTAFIDDVEHKPGSEIDIAKEIASGLVRLGKAIEIKAKPVKFEKLDGSGKRG